MNILVINGSPKGENSVTLQTIRYLEKRYPHVRFEVLNAGARIKGLEKDMKPAIDTISRSQVIIFSYPVYTFIAPSHLHRFIELLKEQNIDLSGKYATQLTTSKHFYDVTGHRTVTMGMPMYLVGGLMSSKKLKAKAGSKMTEGMLAPYKKVLDNIP